SKGLISSELYNFTEKQKEVIDKLLLEDEINVPESGSDDVVSSLVKIGVISYLKSGESRKRPISQTKTDKKDTKDHEKHIFKLIDDFQNKETINLKNNLNIVKKISKTIHVIDVHDKEDLENSYPVDIVSVNVDIKSDELENYKEVDSKSLLLKIEESIEGLCHEEIRRKTL
ncbi:3275_t:CDS:2, partial [Entrophospora sp. SA101]